MRRLLMAILLIAHLMPLLAQHSGYNERFETFEEFLSDFPTTNKLGGRFLRRNGKRHPPQLGSNDRLCRTNKNLLCVEEISLDFSGDREPYVVENYLCKGCFDTDNEPAGGINISKIIKVMRKLPYEPCYYLQDYVSSAGCKECRNSYYYYQ